MDTSSELQKILKKNEDLVFVNKENVENKKVAIVVPTATDEVKAAEGEKDVSKEKDKDTEEKEKRIEIKKTPRVPPKLENIIDCLHFKVNTPNHLYIFVQSHTTQ